MKVLILNTLYHPFQVGGAERSTQLLAERLVDIGHDVVLACTKPERGTDVEVVNGVRVYYLGLKNVYWQFNEEKKKGWLKPVWHALDSYNPFMQRDLAAILSEENPDLIHTHNLGGFSVSAWRAAQKAATPIVHTIRDYSLLCPRNMFHNGSNCTSQCIQCRPFAAPRRWLSQQVTAVVGISRFILDRHRAFGYFSDVEHQTVIHNPFPIRDKSAAEPPETVPTKETGGPLRVGFLGRLSPMKGIDDLLHAVDNLPEECINLRIGGEGTTAFVDSLKATYASTPATFCGFVDPDEFLPGIDTLVVPSRWHEPFGRVVIEAYAHGTPVVVARRGGLPEIVEDGETGWTYDPDDDGALRRRLSEICRTPRKLKEMKKNIIKKSSQFSLKEHTSKYERVYQETLNQNYLNIN